MVTLYPVDADPDSDVVEDSDVELFSSDFVSLELSLEDSVVFSVLSVFFESLVF